MSKLKRPKILLTGFEAFGQHRINSSWEAVRIAGPRLGAAVITERLPVNRLAAARALTALLRQHRPDACLLTGLAGGNMMRIELFARRSRVLAGPDAPGRLSGSWSVAEAALSLRLSGLPVRISRNAGRYVCDSTYWALLQFRQTNGWPRDAGFLHVPPLSTRFTAALLGRAIERLVRRRLALMPSTVAGTGRSGRPG